MIPSFTLQGKARGGEATNGMNSKRYKQDEGQGPNTVGKAPTGERKVKPLRYVKACLILLLT